MKSLTPKILVNYMEHFDYVITLEQAKNILELLDECYGIFTVVDILEAADHVLYRKNLIY